MKNYQKLVAATSTIFLALSLGAPAFADDEYDNAVRKARGEAKAERARCQEMKGAERTTCLNNARTTERRTIADAERKYGSSTKSKGASPQGSSEIAGGDKMQKGPSHHDRAQSALPTAAPKSAPEIAGTDKADKGMSRVDRAQDKSGAMSPPHSTGASEVAGGDQKGRK